MLVQLLLDLFHKTMLLLLLAFSATTAVRLVVTTAAGAALLALAACRRGDALLLHEAVRLTTRTRLGGVKVTAVGLQTAGLDVLLASALLLALIGGKAAVVAVVLGVGSLGARGRGSGAVRAGVAAVLARDAGEIAGTGAGDANGRLVLGGGLLGGLAFAVNVAARGVVGAVDIWVGEVVTGSVEVLVGSVTVVVAV